MDDASQRNTGHGPAGAPDGGAPDSRTPDGLSEDEVRRLHRALALFGAGAWFTCHEVLERLWLEETRPERDVYKGILQIAVGLLHEENGNRSGALRLLERGAVHLAPFLPVRFGVDIATLRDQALHLRAVLAALSLDRRLEAERWNELLPGARQVD